jgi:hypothetical protein
MRHRTKGFCIEVSGKAQPLDLFRKKLGPGRRGEAIDPFVELLDAVPGPGNDPICGPTGPVIDFWGE